MGGGGLARGWAHLEHGLPGLHVGEDLHVVGHVSEGGRVVVGVDHLDGDGHRRAPLDAVRRHHLETPPEKNEELVSSLEQP